MPYIDPTYRGQFDKYLNDLPPFMYKGELEYCIFKLLVKYMSTREYNYTNLHDATYAAQHCADEFRRRFLDEREKYALTQNGDIYK